MAGRGKRPRIAQSYAAMGCDEGVQTFNENNTAKKGQLSRGAAADNNEEIKREDYIPLKIENSANLFFCRKVKECKHQCLGVKGESTCLPCLEPACIPANSRDTPKTEMCCICYTCELSEEPSVKLGCGHIFHANCVRNLLQHRWSTLRITFAFMDCPQCK